MKKDLYLIDIYEDIVTGFSTYKKELFSSLCVYSQVNLNQIILGSPSSDFFIEKVGLVNVFHIPCIESKRENNYILSTLLQLFIEDTPNTVFFQNFSPSYTMVKLLKDSFPLCRIVSVVHDFMWAAFLMGDIVKFEEIIFLSKQHEKSPFIHQIYKDGVKAFRTVDKIICLSNDSYSLINTFYHVDKSKIAIVPNGLKDEYDLNVSSINTRRKYNIPMDKNIILYVGRVCKQKGIIDVIECLDSVISIYPNFYLVIAGDIDPITISQINNRVRFHIILLGRLTKVQLYEWYQTADFGILPSYYEQCSYTGIEMKMFGLPIIASDGFGVNNMFTEDNAIIASIGNRDNCAVFQRHLSDNIIKSLKLNEVEKEEYCNKSRSHYLANYTSTLMAKKYIDLIENL